MNKDEIKKALVLCQMSAVSTCRDCPYTENCDGTQLYKDALNLITEQEKAIEELEENIDMLTKEQKGDYDFEIKQAKIDVLNELKDKMFEREYMGVKYKERIFYESEIDEMIAEVQNAENKN